LGNYLKGYPAAADYALNRFRLVSHDSRSVEQLRWSFAKPTGGLTLA
jgi:hypothetical protein